MTTKRLAIKRLLQKLNPDLVLIQETNRDTFDMDVIKALWSLKDVGWSFVEAFGESGGILTMWDESKISVSEVLKGGYSLSVKCSTISRKVCWIMNVYRPTYYRERIFMATTLFFIRLLHGALVHRRRFQYN